MQVRRVVTGHDAQGKATVVYDTVVAPTTFKHVTGFEFHQFWGADEIATFPDEGNEPEYRSYYPPINGVRLLGRASP